MYIGSHDHAGHTKVAEFSQDAWLQAFVFNYIPSFPVVIQSFNCNTEPCKFKSVHNDQWSG